MNANTKRKMKWLAAAAVTAGALYAGYRYPLARTWINNARDKALERIEGTATPVPSPTPAQVGQVFSIPKWPDGSFRLVVENDTTVRTALWHSGDLVHVAER